MANSQLNVSFITNRKGGQNIAYNGNIYRQILQNDDRTFWRCTVSGCPGSLSTLNSIPVGFGRQVHTHPADHTGIVTKQILNHINTRCIDEVKPIPSTVYTKKNLTRSETTIGMTSQKL